MEIPETQTATPVQSPISFTEGALAELRRIMDDMKVPNDYGLRIGVKGGGCSGLSYVMGFDAAKEGDQQYEVDGIRLVMQQDQGMYLVGMQIDYVDGLESRGFVFNNPNANDTCGCGTSFSA